MYIESCAWTVFFFQAEDGIRDVAVTGVQTCALPICRRRATLACACARQLGEARLPADVSPGGRLQGLEEVLFMLGMSFASFLVLLVSGKIGRASCRERV